MLGHLVVLVTTLAAIAVVFAAPTPPLSTDHHLQARSQSYPCNSPLTILDAGDWTQVRALDSRWAGFGGFGDASRFTFVFDGVNYSAENFNVTVYEHTKPTWWEAFQVPLQVKSSWNCQIVALGGRVENEDGVITVGEVEPVISGPYGLVYPSYRRSLADGSIEDVRGVHGD